MEGRQTAGIIANIKAVRLAQFFHSMKEANRTPSGTIRKIKCKKSG